MKLKSVETSRNDVAFAQRIYIPIVGLEWKMSAFEHDTQITVWHLHKKDAIDENYTMILVNDEACYGVKGLDKKGKRSAFYERMAQHLEAYRNSPITHIKVCILKKKVPLQGISLAESS